MGHEPRARVLPNTGFAMEVRNYKNFHFRQFLGKSNENLKEKNTK